MDLWGGDYSSEFEAVKDVLGSVFDELVDKLID